MSEPESEPELTEAVRAGDLGAIRALLDAGADVRYVRPRGYAVMIDAMHGRDILKDPNLLPILRLLIDRGADLDARSDYGESALSVASNVGRFDAVKLLLESGANPAPLGWTALHRAVAFGTTAKVKQRVREGGDLAARDRCGRTPLLLSLQVGDLEKAEILLAAGASLADRRWNTSPLIYPIRSDNPTALRWVLEQGVDPNEIFDFMDSPLMRAASDGASRCVRALLDAGADPNLAGELWSPMSRASNLEIARVLAAAGADFNEISGQLRDELTGRGRTESIECSPEDYQAAKHRVFGDANPQHMNLPFWRAMVAHGGTAYAARELFDEGRYGDEAVWCFDRMGSTFTELPDGRVLEIGGEHEDFYDPDFCIYNDVIVHHGGGRFDIYGYPAEVFPPTDFHAATLVDDHIYIIGSLGYQGDRRFGFTPVYRLNIHNLVIEPLEPSGASPGWIFEHKAKLVDNAIQVSGGKIADLVNGEETHEPNLGAYLLDLDSLIWSKIS